MGVDEVQRMPLAKVYLLLAAAMQASGLKLRWAVPDSVETAELEAQFEGFDFYKGKV